MKTTLRAKNRVNPIYAVFFAGVVTLVAHRSAAQEEGPKLGLCVPEYALQHSFYLEMGNQVGGYSHGPQGGICDQNHPVYSPS